MIAMRVVELGIAEPNLHIGHSLALSGAVGQCAIFSANGDSAGFGHRVTHEVRRKLLVVARAGFTQRCEGAVELGGESIKQCRSRLLRG